MTGCGRLAKSFNINQTNVRKCDSAILRAFFKGGDINYREGYFEDEIGAFSWRKSAWKDEAIAQI